MTDAPTHAVEADGAEVHVVGAGMAGLACAVRLVERGCRVIVHEAAAQAGGRCRSFHDATLARRIDNGNHLLFSGNHAVHRYLERIGAADGLVGPAVAEFPFLDLASGERWVVRPGAGTVPWWILAPGRRVPATRARDYLAGLRLAWAGPEATVASCLGASGVLYRRFWEPLAVAVLNAPAEQGSAALLWPVVLETFGRGERACRPRMARTGLSAVLVDPALAFLAARGAEVNFNRRLRSLVFEGTRVVALDLGAAGSVRIESEARVVLAVPSWAAVDLVPGLVAPRASHGIVNAHFVVGDGRDGISLLGLIGGLAQWLFVRDDVASVTVSAAGDLLDQPADEIARRLWPEVARALELDRGRMPPVRVVKERRATFAQVPAEAGRRPPTRTRWSNLFLAGDWTATGLPATIEGAMRSGLAAAEAARSAQGKP